MVHKRSSVDREKRLLARGENAKEAIGRIELGCEMYGFTKGQFSLINILEHLLDEVGPSDVDMCTWSAAGGDIRAAYRMTRLGSIKKMRFVVDYSFPRRKPDFCNELVEAFGEDAIRVTSIHAKFMTLKAADYSLVVRTSMNLNYNPRFENFEISDDPGLWQFVTDAVDEIWRIQEAYEGLKRTPYENKLEFKGMYAENALETVDPAHLEGITL